MAAALVATLVLGSGIHRSAGGAGGTDDDEAESRSAAQYAVDLPPGLTTRPAGARGGRSGDPPPHATTLAAGEPPAEVEPWSTYGHDARRTFAATGCVPGALHTAWRHVPMPSDTGLRFSFHAVAKPDAVFLDFVSPNPMADFATAQGIVRLTPDGDVVWTKVWGRDATFGHWLTLVPALGAILQNDDGHVLWDQDKGGPQTRVGDGNPDCDWWGQTIVEDDRMYILNEHADDCPPLGLYAFDLKFKQQWSRNEHGGGSGNKGAATDLSQALALDGDVLFHAAHYEFYDKKADLESGVYAVSKSDGKPLWFAASEPNSALSAGDGRVYLVEGSAVVARSQSDGTEVWSQDVSGASRQAPVLAAGLAIVGTDAGVAAFDAATGAPRWTAAVAGASAPPKFITLSGRFGSYKAWLIGYGTEGIYPSTTMAAALGSGTLVVTGSDAVVVLALSDGRELWKGVPDMAQGRVREPVIVGSRIYVTDSPKAFSMGGLLALDAEDVSPAACAGGAAGGPEGPEDGGSGGNADGGGAGNDAAPEGPAATGGGGGCGCRVGEPSRGALPCGSALAMLGPLAGRRRRRGRRGRDRGGEVRR